MLDFELNVDTHKHASQIHQTKTSSTKPTYNGSMSYSKLHLYSYLLSIFSKSWGQIEQALCLKGATWLRIL